MDNTLRKAAIELLKSAPEHITDHWPELDDVVKALAQSEKKQTHNLVHEIDLVLTDPDTSLSVGAQRALQYVSKQLQVTTPPSKEWVSLTDDEIDTIYKQNHNEYGEDITGEYERELEAALKERNGG